MRVTLSIAFDRALASPERFHFLSTLLAELSLAGRAWYRPTVMTIPPAQLHMTRMLALQSQVGAALVDLLRGDHSDQAAHGRLIWQSAASLGCWDEFCTAFSRSSESIGMFRYVDGRFELSGRPMLDLIPQLDHGVIADWNASLTVVSLGSDLACLQNASLDLIRDMVERLLMSPARGTFLALLARNLAQGFSGCHGSPLDGSDPSAIHCLSLANEIMIKVADLLADSFLGRARWPDDVLVSTLLRDDDAGVALTEAPQRQAWRQLDLSAIARDSIRDTLSIDGAFTPDGVCQVPVFGCDHLLLGGINKEISGRSLHLIHSRRWFQDLMAVNSLAEAMSLRSQSNSAVVGVSSPANLHELVSVVVGGISRGNGTELGVGMCLDVLVELLYVVGGGESVNFPDTAHVNSLTRDLTVLSELVTSGEAYTVMSAVELLWILSPNRQMVKRLVGAINVGSLSVSAPWTTRMASDIRLCLAALLESIAGLADTT